MKFSSEIVSSDVPTAVHPAPPEGPITVSFAMKDPSVHVVTGPDANNCYDLTRRNEQSPVSFEVIGTVTVLTPGNLGWVDMTLEVIKYSSRINTARKERENSKPCVRGTIFPSKHGDSCCGLHRL